jgi:hypothetical protein
MRSFTLALVLATAAFAPALADGMKTSEPGKHAGSTQDDDQADMPTPQSSVQVTRERGVRVWRPAAPVEYYGDQQQQESQYYSQPAYTQPSYSQPSQGYYGGGYGLGAGAAFAGSDARNGLYSGKLPGSQTGAAGAASGASASATSSSAANVTVTVNGTAVKTNRENGRERGGREMGGKGEHRGPMGAKPVPMQMGGKPPHQGPAGGKAMAHNAPVVNYGKHAGRQMKPAQQMPVVNRGPSAHHLKPATHPALHNNPAQMRPALRPVMHAPVMHAPMRPAPRPVMHAPVRPAPVKMAARPAPHAVRHR